MHFYMYFHLSVQFQSSSWITKGTVSELFLVIKIRKETVPNAFRMPTDLIRKTENRIQTEFEKIYLYSESMKYICSKFGYYREKTIENCIKKRFESDNFFGQDRVEYGSDGGFFGSNLSMQNSSQFQNLDDSCSHILFEKK